MCSVEEDGLLALILAIGAFCLAIEHCVKGLGALLVLVAFLYLIYKLD